MTKLDYEVYHRVIDGRDTYWRTSDSCRLAGPDDETAGEAFEYDSRCSACYLNHGHSGDYHRAMLSADHDERNDEAAAKWQEQVEAVKLIEVLKVLTEFCTSGRRYHSTNPYLIPEIRAALEVIAESQGRSDYLQADLTPAS